MDGGLGRACGAHGGLGGSGWISAQSKTGSGLGSVTGLGSKTESRTGLSSGPESRTGLGSDPNQIKSLLLSHQHRTCALVSEIHESVLQTVQKQFTYRQYILTDDNVQNTHTYTQYTQCTF